jgi:NAD(P)-dependent dehydrogenase (short-subunit alcohol dehydrogenase family)
MLAETILIGFECAEPRGVADALGARFIAAPPLEDDRAWVAWREGLKGQKPVQNVVVALLPELHTQAPLVNLSSAEWLARGETPLLRWMEALATAAPLCADNGALVAVVDCAPPLDSAGLAPEAGVAEGVEALMRSLSLSEGKRGVRANGVVTPARIVTKPIVAPAPPLEGFPGSLREDVVRTVRLLLSDDAKYLSGHTLPADRGRSW